MRFYCDGLNWGRKAFGIENNTCKICDVLLIKALTVCTQKLLDSDSNL
jgi:hypothetical protein